MTNEEMQSVMIGFACGVVTMAPIMLALLWSPNRERKDR